MKQLYNIFLFLLLALPFSSAGVKAQTTVRYQNQIQGGVTLIGNSWMYSTSATPCNPTGILADIDGDATTTNSSSADLMLPAGSTIVKAYLSIERGLYSSDSPLTSVKFKVAGASAYQTLTPASPSFLINRTAALSGSGIYFNQSIFDITSLMPANGYVSTAAGGAAGRYFVADPIPSVSSNGASDGFRMGGWSIIIVYKNTASKIRSVTVADNWQLFLGGSIRTDVSGVRVPASGTVNAVVGVTGTFGDRIDCSGAEIFTDLLSFGQTTGALTNLADPMTGATNNALNSSIAMGSQNNVSADGGPAMSGNVIRRNPVSAGHYYGAAEAWEYDADVFNAGGILPASATPLNVRLQQSSTSNDILTSGSYFISIDLGTSLLTKSVSPSTISDGGTATYTFTISNTVAGAINQSGISFTDALPSGLRVAAIPNAVITGGTGGTVTAAAGGTSISLSGFSLNAGQTATITVNVTNATGQYNSSCASNPAAFTNNAANITAISSNLVNGVDNVCLVVTAPARPSITGNVYLDTDGVTNINGTATNAGGTFVNVIDSNNLLVYSATVSAAGVFTIPTGIVVEPNTYRLELSKNTGTIGATAPVKELPLGWGTVGENKTGVSPFPNDGANDGTINYTIGTTNITGLRFGVNICTAGSTAPPVKDLSIVCPATTINLNTAHTGTVPLGSTLVWFTNNTHTGTALSGTQITAAGSGTYYAYYYDSVGGCYSPVSTVVNVSNSSNDSDGDGIADACDLDDDNDGILDTAECGSNDRISNGIFPTSGGDSNTVLGWTVGGTYAASGPWASPTGRVNLNANGLEFKRDFNTVTTLSQNLTGVMPGASLSLNNLYWFRTAGTETNTTFTFTISYGGVNYVTIASPGVSTPTVSASNGATVNMSSLPAVASQGNISAKTNLIITLPLGSFVSSGQLLFTFTAGPDPTQGRDLGMQSVTLFSCKDTDGDGIADYLDLDSDADGCSDATEGGASIIEYRLVTAGGTVTGGNTSVNQNLCASSACVSPSGTNIGLPQQSPTTGYSNTTGQSVGNSQNTLVNDCLCYESPTDVSAIVPVKHGITALERANRTETNGNWPMLRNSAYTALESKTKGFVVTRTTSPETTVLIPVIGMMVFDTDEDGGKGCLKIYTGSGAGEGWKCFTTQGCPPPSGN